MRPPSDFPPQLAELLAAGGRAGFQAIHFRRAAGGRVGFWPAADTMSSWLRRVPAGERGEARCVRAPGATGALSSGVTLFPRQELSSSGQRAALGGGRPSGSPYRCRALRRELHCVLFRLSNTVFLEYIANVKLFGVQTSEALKEGQCFFLCH